MSDVRIIRATFISLALAAIAVASVSAHHSFAPFNMQEEKTLVGTVKEFQWTNPHSWIWLNVPNAKGGVELWGVEGMSPNYLGRRGWSRTTFKPGDKVTVVVRPARDGSLAGIFVRATLPNGRQLTFAAGDPPEPVTQK
jgi:hypothetical protein